MNYNLHEIKLLNNQFYHLIKRLRKNHFNQSAKLACLAYEILLKEISLVLKRKN